MNIEERVEIAILMKYYGAMLTDKQRDVLSMYVDSNLSLGEIAEELKISRQAVNDCVATATKTLKQLEEKLNFIARDNKIKQTLENKSSKEIDLLTKLEILSILEEE